MATLPITAMIRPCERLIKNVRFEAKPRQLGHIDPNLKRLISGNSRHRSTRLLTFQTHFSELNFPNKASR